MTSNWKAKAKIDAYLTAALPEFPPAAQTQGERLVKDLAVEVIMPSNPAEAAAHLKELLALSSHFGLALDIETASLPLWKEDRPPLILKEDGSLASKQHRYAPEAPLDPHRSRIRLLQVAGKHRPLGPNRVVVIDTDLIPVTDPALLPIWRSRLWIHNAAFDAKHLIAAGVDMSHAKIIDAMLLAGMVHRCEALEAIIRIEKVLRKIPRARLIAQVHDEFLLEAAGDQICIEDASAALTASMREGFAALFPHAPQTGLVDVGVGRNWGGELK